MFKGNVLRTHKHTYKHSEKNQRAILKQVNTLAWMLDNSIPIPILNYRIGVDALIGLIPGFGDIAGSLISSYIVLQAIRLGAPRTVLVRMVVNVAIELIVGIVPVVGDFFDATFKANARNVELLNEALGAGKGGRATGAAANRGAIAVVVGALLAVIALFGGLGIALFWWVVSLFR